jgi:adenine phosphoribosyltransferase
VDQWIETGGTMEGAIELVERQKGTVTGLVAIAMEDTPRASVLRERFPTVTAIQPGTRWQEECNAQTLSSFDDYDPSHAFPTS